MVSILVLISAIAGPLDGGAGPSSPAVRLEVQGHRGARAVRPENTLAAFRYALDVGVDVLELDVVVTKDEHLVVAHDLFMNPDICLGPGGARIRGRVTMRSLTLEELRRYDCGTLQNPRFPTQQPAPGERIPTLEEVFELLEETEGAARVRLNIEAKSVPSRPDLTFTPERWAEVLVGVLEKSGRGARVNVQSFDHRILRALKARLPEVPISALVAESLPDLVELARDLGAEIISPNLDWITGPTVAALHAAGVRVIPWTANTPADWARLVKLGVDGIITDDPAGLIAFLKEEGLR